MLMTNFGLQLNNMFFKLDIKVASVLTVLLLWNTLRPIRTQDCPVCQYGGTCVNDVCQCPPGLTGTTCTNVICDNYPCFNGGTCMTGMTINEDTCQCPNGFVPPFCATSCSSSCFNGGTCNNGVCSCASGFVGPICADAFFAYLNPIEITVEEGNSDHSVTVQLCRQPASMEITLGVFTLLRSAISGSDFDDYSSSVTLMTGQVCTPVSVTIKTDQIFEMTEQFSLILGIPTSSLSSSVYIVPGQQGTVITITNDDPANCDNFHFCFNGGTCRPSELQNPCICPPGYVEPFCTTSCINDPCQNGGICADDVCSCSIFHAGPTCQSSIAVYLSPLEVSVTEGNTGDVTVQIYVCRISYFQSPISFTVFTSQDSAINIGTDFIYINTSVTIPRGELCVPVDITIISDTIYELTEEFRLIISTSQLELSQYIVSGQGTATITIIDNDSDTQPPTISNCPDDISVSTTLGESTTASWRPPTASDLSGGVTVMSSHSPGDDFLCGVTTVTYTVTDGAGNVADCIFTVTVLNCTRLSTIGACAADECYCNEGTCDSQTGICETNCSVFQCPTNISSEKLSRVNPQSSVQIKCILEGSTAIVNGLTIILSRSEEIVETNGTIQDNAVEINPNRRETTFTLISVAEDDQVFCLLTMNGSVFGAVNVTGFVYTFCVEVAFNDTAAGLLTFPATNTSTMVESVQQCPSYSTEAARASLRCEGDLVSPSYWGVPRINNCFEGTETDEPLNDLSMYVDSNPVTADNVTEVSRDLADAIDTTAINLVIVATLLEHIVNVGSPSPEVTSNVLEAVDNVLMLQQDTYDGSVPIEALTRILQSLEAQLTNLHDGGEEVNFTDVRANVGAIAKSFDQSDFTDPITFGNFFANGSRNIRENLNESETIVFKGDGRSLIDDIKAQITLPISLLNRTMYKVRGRVPITFIIHRTSLLFSSNASLKMEEEVESLIISATVEGEKLSNLESPVVSKFNLLPVEGSTKDNARRCVFWDFSLAGGLGGWSSEGCEIAEAPSGSLVVECQCYHLTNFAILLDIQGDIDNIVLDVLSIIGCVVSIIALIITIITYLAVKKFRSQRPKQILVHLCFALLGLYLSFLIGIDLGHLQIGCVIFGALIHFFCLASVAWMGVEAVNLYLLFVRIFDSGVTGFMWKAMVAAWGTPLIVVVVSVVARPNNFRGDYCFPQAGTLTLYIGVMALLALMLVGNGICFALIVRQLTCGRSALGKDRDKRQEVIRYIAMSVLLGLTWIFGFLAIGGGQFIFNLLFLIFNSLQGFFIFFFFCLRQEEVRNIWWQWLRCRFTDVNRHMVGKNVTSSSGKNRRRESIQMGDSEENGKT